MLDQGALNRLFTLEKNASPGLVKELCALFAVNFPASLLEIRAALAREDACVITDKAHYLKSCCGHFGAVGLSQLLEDLECTAKLGDFARMREQYEELERVAVAVKAEIAALPSKVKR